MPPAIVFKTMSALHNGLYRASGGKVGGTMKGAPILLLTTTGAKSGKPRTTPLLYVEDGPNLGVIASKGGAPSHPSWYVNLRANPEVEVEIGRERKQMRARTAAGEERGRIWNSAVSVYAPYADYQRRTEREIPVVVLEDL